MFLAEGDKYRAGVTDSIHCSIRACSSDSAAAEEYAVATAE